MVTQEQVRINNYSTVNSQLSKELQITDPVDNLHGGRK